jgi:uncharacterized iron-regulated protein
MRNEYRLLKKLLGLSIIALVFEVCCCPLTWADPVKAFRLIDRKTISFEQMVDDLKKADLVFVGETHDRKLHHQLQLDIIKALYRSKTEVAVGFEMFTAGSQTDIDHWVAGTVLPDDFVRIYYRNWNFPWLLYKDILMYVRDNKIPSLGLNLPPDIPEKVARSGFSSLTKEEREKLPPETGCAVDEKYMKFIRRAYAMHGHKDRQFLYFCEAQLLWDQAMAKNLIEFLKKNPRRTVIVLTGNGHAWKRGIPEQVHTVSAKTSYRVVLPDVSGSIDPSSITVEDADYILLK